MTAYRIVVVCIHVLNDSLPDRRFLSLWSSHPEGESKLSVMIQLWRDILQSELPVSHVELDEAVIHPLGPKRNNPPRSTRDFRRVARRLTKFQANDC